jgi:hypothetical protein
VVWEPNGGDSRGWRGRCPFISERNVGHGGKSVLGMWGLGRGPNWVGEAVERVRGGQGLCLAL